MDEEDIAQDYDQEYGRRAAAPSPKRSLGRGQEAWTATLPRDAEMSGAERHPEVSGRGGTLARDRVTRRTAKAVRSPVAATPR